PLQPFPPVEPSSTSPVKLTPTGYIETYYQWNFNHPSNGITNYRGFDNRHNTFTIQNVALGTYFESGPVGGKLMLQVGSMPTTYYAVEPTLAGAKGANATGPELWKYIQEAYVTYKVAIGRGLELKAGIVASPIGMESFAVHDHWSWSRSNLFFGLPYYHTGLRATYELGDRVSAEVSVLNGWNSVVDNNEAKSVETHVTYRVPNKVTAQLLYFGGIERSAGVPEGQYWRHHFDAVGEVHATDWLQVAAQADYGFEPNRFGTASWYAGAISARAKATDWLYLVARGDRFYENLATDAQGHASTPLFWNGVEWVSSFTATVDVRPHDNISVRLEARHDQADGLLYFTGDSIVGDGSARTPYLPNARSQETVLLGATAWF
ncbi:MAG: outer membrane protein, partial [Myxococcaceae bacterium]|nr:outer membrane protein [Myxococcaceae bacterium]